MKRVLPFVAGAGMGYVMGTRAGHERYEAIKTNLTSGRHQVSRMWDKWPRGTDGRRSVNPSGLIGTAPVEETPVDRGQPASTAWLETATTP